MTTTRLRLYDAKDSCELCSSTFVRRRVDSRTDHAQRHVEAGDAILIEDGEYFVEVRTEQ